MRAIRNGWMAVAVLCGAGLAGAGCQNKVHDENQRLWQQNRELQARLDERGQMVEQPRPAQPAPPPPIVVREAPTTRPVAALPPAPAPIAPAPRPQEQIGGFETRTDPGGRSVTVTVPGDVLFDAGRADIKQAVRPALDQVAATLKNQYAGRPIQVHGHTDSDPIKVSKWKSNQELSEARAAAVKNYLVRQGIDAGQVTTVGHGADQPRSQSKASNRRVEIKVNTSGVASNGAGGASGNGAAATPAAAGGRVGNGTRQPNGTTAGGDELNK